MIFIDIHQRVEKIYINNKRIINAIVKKQVESDMDKLSLLLNEKSKVELKSMIFDELIEKIKRQIEHIIIIEELYPESIKEEAFKKLPQYILKLR